VPTRIRRYLTGIVLLVTIAAFLLERQAGQGGMAWYVLMLGLALAGAIWLFPEAKKSDRTSPPSERE
jgi:thiol:disulfide interchange protein